MTLVWKTSPVVANIDVQDEGDIVISADDDEVTLTEEGMGDLFKDTYSEKS